MDIVDMKFINLIEINGNYIYIYICWLRATDVGNTMSQTTRMLELFLAPIYGDDWGKAMA